MKQIRRRKGGPALLITAAFATAETCLAVTVVSLLVWFAPAEPAPNLTVLLFDPSSALFEAALAIAYAIVIAFPRAVLRGRGFRDVPESPRRARGVGRGAGVAACVCGLSSRWRSSSRSRRLIGAAQPAAPIAGDATPTRTEVREALDKVKSDPNLAPVRTVNMLRWTEPEPVTDEPWWWQWMNALARWFRGLFGWIAESGRYVVWVLGALLAALLALYVVRLVRGRGLPRVPKPFAAPSHVRTSTFAPRACPMTSASAARALWQRGEQRAALALLYRGSLSRLVHVHARADPRVGHGGRVPRARAAAARGGERALRRAASSRRGRRPSTAG